MSNYYNENDPKAAAWLRELIKSGEIPNGEVDERSIIDVTPTDLFRFTQCHFFAGIGGWSLALKLSGWPEDMPVWTGSCPCQPFSEAGNGRSDEDSRHLWPAFFDLIRQCRPERIFGEQVYGAIRHGWLDWICADLAKENYACGSIVLGAHSVGAPHTRQRIYWTSYPSGDGRQRIQRCAAPQVQKNGPSETLGSWNPSGSPFVHWKELMAQSCIVRVDDGISSNVDIRPRLRAYGNAIVPQVAAEFIGVVMGIL